MNSDDNVTTIIENTEVVESNIIAQLNKLNLEEIGEDDCQTELIPMNLLACNEYKLWPNTETVEDQDLFNWPDIVSVIKKCRSDNNLPIDTRRVRYLMGSGSNQTSTSSSNTQSQLDNSINSQTDIKKSSEELSEVNTSQSSINLEIPIQRLMSYDDLKVSNIPQNMISDQYGIAGVLSNIHTTTVVSNIKPFGFGYDMSSFNMDLNSPECLLENFGGPWADTCKMALERSASPRYSLGELKNKLPTLVLSKYEDDVLFYLYYTKVKNEMQLQSATELMQRGWRFHMSERLWISRIKEEKILYRTEFFEISVYNFFDPEKWEVIQKKFCLEYAKLEPLPEIKSVSTSSENITE